MTGTNAYLFVDLDDSLLQTRDKCRHLPLLGAALDRSGVPLSFHTPQQIALLDLFRDATLIPVTGRNLDALRRVVSPPFSSYRITSHGALVLGPDEQPLGAWRAALEGQLPLWSERLTAISGLAHRQIRRRGLGLRARIIEDLGFPVYLSVKGPPKELERLADDLAPEWTTGIVHRNDHNLALLPPFANKATAVRHVMGAIRAACGETPLFIGIGDSLTDLPFLRLCHFALVPQHSQIQECTWS